MSQVTVIGPSLKGLGDEIIEELVVIAVPIVDDAAEFLVHETRELLSGPGGVSNGPPALQEGHLRDSMGREPVKVQRGRFGVDVGATWGTGLSDHPEANAESAKHALITEWGGRAGPGRQVNIPPHPYIWATVEQHRARVEQMLEQI